MRKWRSVLLAAILLSTLLWRLINLDWGFPDLLEDNLSVIFLWDIWGVFSGNITFEPLRYDWSPFYYYIIFCGQFVYYLLGRLFGTYADITALRLEWVLAPQTLYYIGRLVTISFAVGSIGLLYKLGQRFFKSSVVLLGILFFSLDPIFLRYSQTLQTDIPLLFFFLLACYFIQKIYEQGQSKHYVAAGIAIGLGAATKYIPIILLLPAVINHFLRVNVQKKPWFSYKLLMLIILPPLVFVAVLPHSILNFSHFYQWVGYQLSHLKGGHFTNRSRWLFPGTGIQSWWMHLIVLMSTLYFILKEKKITAFIYLLIPFFFYLFIIRNKTAFDYYLLPTYPFFYLLIANALNDAAIWGGDLVAFSNRKLSRTFFLFVMSSLFLMPIIKADIIYLNGNGQKSTITRAKEWIEKNIESKAIIISEIPPPRLQTFRLAAYYLRSPSFSKVIPQLATELGKRPIYYVHHVKLNVFDPSTTEAEYDLDKYRLFPYFIVNYQVAGRYLKKAELYPVHARFYADIAREFKEVARFQPQNPNDKEIIVYYNPLSDKSPKTPKASIALFADVVENYRKQLKTINYYLTSTN